MCGLVFGMSGLVDGMRNSKLSRVLEAGWSHQRVGWQHTWGFAP